MPGARGTVLRLEYQAGELTPHRKPKSSQLSGLALIESLYFCAGASVAQQQLQRLLGPEQDVRPYAFCDTGQPSVGMDIAPEDEIAYESFSPPASWNAAYSIQRVRLGPNEKSEFVFHPGEELVIPTRGSVAYHFFWSPGSSLPQRIVLHPPIGTGKILRINPQIPHHAWGAKEEAVAWLVLRHATNSPVTLVMDGDASVAVKGSGGPHTSLPVGNARTSSAARAPMRRRVTANELRKPGAYAMIAWGISELIRDTRQKTGLTTTDLARHVGIDPSSLSRLEEAKANVSIEMLAKVCRVLRIGIGERIASGSWIHESAELNAKSNEVSAPVLYAPSSSHYLHPYVQNFSPADRCTVETGRSQETVQISSWIVLKGKLLVELPSNLGGRSILAETGNVIHFRETLKVAVQALQPSSVVQIVYSQSCHCKRQSPSSELEESDKPETDHKRLKTKELLEECSDGFQTM